MSEPRLITEFLKNVAWELSARCAVREDEAIKFVDRSYLKQDMLKCKETFKNLDFYVREIARVEGLKLLEEDVNRT